MSALPKQPEDILLMGALSRVLWRLEKIHNELERDRGEALARHFDVDSLILENEIKRLRLKIKEKDKLISKLRS